MILDKYNPYKNATIVKDSSGKYYDCTLNQTDIKSNKNKFYIMQLVKNNSDYIVFIRYGRVGVKGTVNSIPYTDKCLAERYFNKQFRSKTGNMWGSKFSEKKGKYFLADISYDKELEKIDIPKTIKIPKSKLHKKVFDFIQMISDINMVKNALIELDIDPKKMPLGKITESQLSKAKSILDVLSKTVDNNMVCEYSSKYYTYIPISCGRTAPPLINNPDIIAKYRDLIDELSNIAVGINIIKKSDNNYDKNPIDNIYDDINTKLSPLRKNTSIYKNINKFIINTHGCTHGCKLELLDIFKVAQEGKEEAYMNHSENISNKMLLFHGTPQSCVLSIFKKDFYLDPSKLGVQIAGKMFGYGVYFADCATKSFNYTRANSTQDVGCLLVAEVALGNMYECDGANPSIDKAFLGKFNCSSTKGLGKWAPSSSTTLPDGTGIPNGMIEEVNNKAYLRYNEYIVYDINQILIKYVCVVKNSGSYGGW